MDEEDNINEVLDIQQRHKRAMTMRRYSARIERAREIARKKMAPESNIRKRAYVKARQLVRKRVAGERGAEYEKLGPSEKMAIDRAVEGKQKVIKKLALRLIPKIKQAESKRLQSYTHGKTIENQGTPEGHHQVKEDLNALFTENFPPYETTSTVRGQNVSTPIATDTGAKRMPKKGSSKNADIIQYNKFQEELQNDTPVFSSLFKKSEKSGVDLEVIGEVFDRGWNTWTEETGVSQQQYAFARVNSFINQGKTYFNEDADLHEGMGNILIKKDEATHQTDTTIFPNSSNPRKLQTLYHRSEGAMNNHIRTLKKKYGAKNVNIKVTKLNEDADLHEAGSKYNIPMSRTTNKAPTRTFTSVLDEVDVPAKHLDRARSVWNRTKDVEAVKKFVSSISEGFKNWTFDLKPGDKTKVLTGDHKGKRGVVVSKHDGGESYTIKHADGSTMKHHISTLEDPMMNEEIKGWKNAGRDISKSRRQQADAAKEVKLVRLKKNGEESKLHDATSRHASEHEARKKHELLVGFNPGKGIAHNLYVNNKLVDTLKEGLEDPEDNPCWKGYKPVGTKKKAGKTVPNCVPEAVEKVTGTNCKNCSYWREDLVRPVSKDELNENGGLKAPSSEYLKMSKEVDLATLPGKATVSEKGFCDHKKVMEWVTERMCCALWDGEGTKREYKGDATFMEQDDTMNGTSLVNKVARNSKRRASIEKVDRAAPHVELGKQTEIQRKIIENHPNCGTPECCGQCPPIEEKLGNVESKPANRLIGTDKLTNAYKKDTPGEGKNLDESFNIAFAAGVGVTLTAKDLGMQTQSSFAYHPSVVEEMNRRAQEVEEEVRSADVKGEVVPAHMRTVTDPKTGAITQVTVPGHVRKGRINRKIIGSGNVTDGEPPQ